VVGYDITIDIKLVKLQTHSLLLDTTAQQQITDDFGYSRIGWGELGCKAVGIHLSSFAVRFVKDILLIATKGGGIACSGEIIELLIGCLSEVQ